MFNLYENCASPVPAVKNKKASILLYINALIIYFVALPELNCHFFASQTSEIPDY
jgi:hypothetical protein